MAGYSGTPLAKKLGIAPGAVVAVLDAPEGALAELELPPDVALRSDLRGAHPLDVIVYFTRSRARFEAKLGALRGRLAEAGGLWICWPKRASGVATDMTEGVVREVAIPAGLVDNKVCAIDATWSGLRLVIPRRLRRAAGRRAR